MDGQDPSTSFGHLIRWSNTVSLYFSVLPTPLPFSRPAASLPPIMTIRAFFYLLLATLLIASPIFQVVRCQSDVDTSSEVEIDDIGNDGGDDDNQDFGDVVLTSAPGIDTVCVFPQNSALMITAGEETELLVGVNNDGKLPLNVAALRASVHFSFDHQMVVQNLTVQEFYNTTVPGSVQATFLYVFAVSKYLQPGTFDLVGTIFYEIDQQPYRSVFYNSTIEVVEAGGFLSIESVFLFTLGVALLGILGLWVYGQIQNISKKTKKRAAPKVELGTVTSGADMDEWLKGTSFDQSLSHKAKKKK
ncbi:putative Translocon-associated protein, alpha subunit [Zostera marina]|uniref:Translocon-associated protein subunit alpha n=1 Tax=Zostera marina TaxID=29655 RepID=A0A0K9PUG6_ZOSMR|nr:putative Translocon-associated protein, alpha subunit [Zostera marina]